MAVVFDAADHDFMARALRLAERGLCSTSPNPRVGCLLVRNGKVIGEGWHERAGGAHAEAHALHAAGEAARGATAYVTLEPCCHHARTPPCVDALLAAGVARVVAAMRDPNPLVSGKGLGRLREAGVAVACGLLAPLAEELNAGFVSRMRRGRPWLRLKMAASLDGRTALRNGQSQWLTGPAARLDGHRWRARACAILSGIGTVRADDPQLNVRGEKGTATASSARQPLKVIVDSALHLPPSARLLRDGQVLVATTAASTAERLAALQATGADVVVLPEAQGKVDLAALCAELGRREINELHVEAGNTLSGSLLAAGLVDELLLYLAPCLLGNGARGMFALPQIEALADRCQLIVRDLRFVGPDLRVLAHVLRSEQETRAGWQASPQV